MRVVLLASCLAAFGVFAGEERTPERAADPKVYSATALLDFMRGDLATRLKTADAALARLRAQETSARLAASATDPAKQNAARTALDTIAQKRGQLEADRRASQQRLDALKQPDYATVQRLYFEEYCPPAELKVGGWGKLDGTLRVVRIVNPLAAVVQCDRPGAAPVRFWCQGWKTGRWSAGAGVVLGPVVLTGTHADDAAKDAPPLLQAEPLLIRNDLPGAPAPRK